MAFLTRQLATVYTTSDGKQFFDVVEAEKHQLKLNIMAEVERLGIGAGGEWSQQAIAESIAENANTFSQALRIYGSTEVEK